MLRFIFRKMLNKKWMILSLLIGNIFLISIAMSGPMYTRAVTQNLLLRTFSDSYAETGKYPATFTLEASLAKASQGAASTQKYLTAKSDMANLPANLKTPALYEIEYSRVDDFTAGTNIVREDANGSYKLSVSRLTGLEEHAVMIEGTAMSGEPDENGVYDAMISRTAFVRKGLLLGEELTYQYITAPDGNPLTLRVAGVFDSSDDAWWTQDESFYAGDLFINADLFDTIFVGTDTQAYPVYTQWTTLIDHTKMKAEDVDAMISTISALKKQYNMVYITPFIASCDEMLTEYRTEANRASATLTVLEVPIFALLIAFIFMVSRQILEIEQSEICVLKSRGASGGQIMRMYLLQGLILALIGFAASVPMSAFLCRAIGSASAFLEFKSRVSLDVIYDARTFIYAAAAAVVGILVMVLPAISYSRLTIVDAKRGRHALGAKPVWQKFYFDIILLGVSVYGLYTFGNQRAVLAEKVASGAALDPLIYISSSLFAVGASLFMVRIIPMLASLVFRLFKNRLSPSLYASFLQILRSRKNQAFMMTFLMLTIAIGILNADTARTVNDSQEEQLRYEMGSDIILKEAWYRTNGEYTPTDAARYGQIEGVESVAKVINEDQSYATIGTKNINGVKLMGIDARDFGNTAYMKDGLLDNHFFTYLNAMSQTLNCCLVSSNFRDILGCDIGDTINVKTSDSSGVNVVIADFVDYFPSYSSKVRVTDADGVTRQADKYLVVANFGYLQSAWGVSPYEIWLKSPDSADNVYAYARESGTRYWSFADIYTRLNAMRVSPIIQGTNGILTLSFIVGLTLCAAGFLIFWILSIKSRSLQFGIYRAMGMNSGEVVAMLINEHLWQSVTSVISGAGIGVLVSRFFIPLIQIAYTSADSPLPLGVTRDVIDHIRLIVIITAVLVVCVCVLTALIRRLKIAQALKLGED